MGPLTVGFPTKKKFTRACAREFFLSKSVIYLFFIPKNIILLRRLKKYYFRVKVFNIIDENKNWISADGSQLIKQYSKNIKINLKQQSEIPFGKI